MSPVKLAIILPLSVAVLYSSAMAQQIKLAATDAMNALGLELLSSQKSPSNALISPYSIQLALAMTYAGADGKTREEMARVLHYPADDSTLHASFAKLQKLMEITTRSSASEIERSENDKDAWMFHRVTKSNAPPATLELVSANRLFGQQSFEFRRSYLDLVNEYYSAPLEPVDFEREAEAARVHINQWVEEQTRRRITDLLPPKSLQPDSKLVLVNTAYFKSSWAGGFDPSLTAPRPFYLHNGTAVDVPTMHRTGRFGYAKEDGYTVITLPYTTEEVQFLILMPDSGIDLMKFEKSLTADGLSYAANVPQWTIRLEMPKFSVAPPLMTLSEHLRALGMTSAFDDPRGSANFDRMAPRPSPAEYLYISEVFHKTFLKLDEYGTEAAAATAVAMRIGAGAPQKPPEEVRVNRPFIFAIQHTATGACLFLGRVTDPR